MFKANIYSYPVRKNERKKERMKERKNIYLSIFIPSPRTNPVTPQSLTPSLKSDP
jgi:hypothetical protein